MRRREFIAMLAGGVAWPLASLAQERGRTYRLGFLLPTPRKSPAVAAFFDELRLNGFVEGDNLTIIPGGFEATDERLAEQALALANAAPDAIVAGPELPLQALQAVTHTVPLIGMTEDMVAAGFVKSLARPGGNITGFTSSEFAMSGKILQVVKEAAPAVNRVVVIYNAAQIPQVGRLAAIQTVAPSLGVQVRGASAADADQITHIIENLGNASGDGMIVLPNPITIANRILIIALAGLRYMSCPYLRVMVD